MIYKIPTANQPLTIHDFKPGFSFQLLTEAGKWETITIHKQCAEELIAFTIRAFKRTPEEFRRVKK